MTGRAGLHGVYNRAVITVPPIVTVLAQAAPVTVQRQKVWLVTLILAVVVAFLCLLFFLLAMRLYRRGKRPRLAAAATSTASVWAAAGDRVPMPESRPPDGLLGLPPIEELGAGEEPFWDAEDEDADEDGESWDDDGDDGDDGDEPWR